MPADSRSPVETDGEITYQTRAVLAEAYPRHQRKFLTHVALVDRADRVVRVLCNRVRADSLADPFADDPASVPTCQTCLKRDPRFVSTPAPTADDVELDSPNFEHPAVRKLADRNFVRINNPRRSVSPPRVEGLPETCGGSPAAVLTRCIIDAALYANGPDAWRGNGQTNPADRIRARELVSVLDALAVAVKGCDAELPDGTLCGEYDATRIALCNSCERQRDTAIQQLLSTRETR